MKKEYNADSIQILEGLEAVRKRPGMYIGPTDIRGLHHLVWEIVDNSIDEALNGFGDKITIQINKDNSITVIDRGRGMPVGKHSSGQDALEVIFTKLHAGGKFSSELGYKTAGGLHGVGASVVNALSKWVLVDVYNNGFHYQIKFEDGGKKSSGVKKLEESSKHGSIVTFMPDEKIFSNIVCNYQTICEKAQEKAFLLSNICLEVKDLRVNKETSFKYEDGLISYMDYLNGDQDTLHETFYFEGKSNEISVFIALQYTNRVNENIYSFANMVRTSDGGTHEVGFKTAITKTINDYARKVGILKEKDKNFDGVEVREGLCAILSVTIPENLLQFESQVKSKLASPIVKTVVENLVSEKLNYFLVENVEVAEKIVKKIQIAAKAREAARKAKDEIRAGKKNNSKIEKVLSGKLANAQLKDASKTELFLVEGESAGGSAKQGRDSKFQAILPLKGKVLNTEKVSSNDIENNDELKLLIHAIGSGYGSGFEIKDINYDKIIIMTDADTDGAHIQILLLTFFYRYMKPLIEFGHVFLAIPPLYKVVKDRKIFYCYDDDELENLRKEFGKCEIQRYKGLGEMNADQLWDTTMNPKNRKLIKVNIEDASKAERNIYVLMGNDASLRRNWIEDHVVFSLEDNYREENEKN